MARTGWYQQQCKCGTDRPAAASITLAGSTLRQIPRRKSRAITIYICKNCLKSPAVRTRREMVAAILAAGKEVLNGHKKGARK